MSDSLYSFDDGLFLLFKWSLLVEKFNFKIITDPADLMKFVQHLKESNRKVSARQDHTWCFFY